MSPRNFQLSKLVFRSYSVPMTTRIVFYCNTFSLTLSFRMPCGQKDLRLKRRRCVHCRREHAKCDGGRPCSICTKRGLKCAFSTPTSNFTIVSYQHRLISSALGACRPTSEPSYASFFFNLVGSATSPFSQLSSFEAFGDLFRDDDLVRRAVTLVGKAYLAESASSVKSNSRLKHHARSTLSDLRAKVLKSLKSSLERQCRTGTLISASLLGLTEVGYSLFSYTLHLLIGK
ncbi:hypothetical protein BP00DRAFT_4669 [Aspergillus indologenus CBS 114.80]|uniref:Zn(2)-C6 fungal-type domain-containing protein n=1 Tax=Aspergillus indologenus CBS 114.80 TaxID=1450541 RepID=A0A2V5J3S0_9EURO|nr:hypothetical protein BP00DRAFT_4669 [Aspergillus indologenus CBS 114.80]